MKHLIRMSCGLAAVATLLGIVRVIVWVISTTGTRLMMLYMRFQLLQHAAVAVVVVLITYAVGSMITEVWKQPR